MCGSVRGHWLGLAPGIHDRPREHVARLMQLNPQGGDDAEVAAAAPYCPEQLGLLIGTGRHAPPVREHDIGVKQVVRCQVARPLRDWMWSYNRNAAAAQMGNSPHEHPLTVPETDAVRLSASPSCGSAADTARGLRAKNRPLSPPCRRGRVSAHAT